MPAAWPLPQQSEEIGTAVGADTDQLGVEHRRLGRKVGQHGGHARQPKFDAAARKKPHHGSVLDGDASEAVEFGLMDPVVACRRDLGERRDLGVDERDTT